MDLSEGKLYALLDKDGKIICLGQDKKFISKDISEVKSISNVFTFWKCNIEELKQYLKAYNDFFHDRDNGPGELDFQEISFLEIKKDDDGEIYFC